MTIGKSWNSISSSDKARITETDACEPQVPPVSINIGIKAVRITHDAKAYSNPWMIFPVMEAEIINNNNQGIRFL